jgi:hypothetical protein
MDNNLDRQKDQLDKWAEMWDKAQDKGIFDDATNPHVPSPNTADDSFFGLKNTHPTSDINDVDAKYWASLYKTPDMNSKEELLQEEQKVQEATDIASSWTDPKKNKKYPANPLAVDSGEKDQTLKPQQLGVTFDEKDIEKLINIKNQLHELENKMIASLVDGKSTKSIEKQIENLKSKLDQLSSALNHPVPNDVAD